MAITHKDGTVSHVGMCLSSSTDYNSSMDVTSYYVIAYNQNTTEFDRIYVKCDYPSDEKQASYTLDATDEVKAIWQGRKAAAAKAQREREELIELMTPRVGKLLQVIRGRKVAKGTTGECFWVGNTAFGTRIGIKDAKGVVYWTAVDNVQVV